MAATSSTVARMVNHLESLIGEGKRVAALERPSSYAPYIQGNDEIPLACMVGTDEERRGRGGCTF